MLRRHVAIAGGGASGLLAAHALIAGGAAVTVFEPREQLGIGVAYATTCPQHFLNAPAANMSGVHGDPAHFVRWLDARGNDATPSRFAPRELYGRYLRSIAAGVAHSGGERFRHRRTAIVDLDVTGSGVSLTGADGTTVDADACIVAVGNPEPAPWPRLGSAANSPRYYRSAWADGATAPERADETVVILGTGLTAIDAVLGLRHNGHRGDVVMVSRRGLLPQEHRLFDSPPAAAPDALRMRDLLGALRHEARNPSSERGWRGAIDALRVQTNARWRSWDIDDQRRFVRHVLPYWNVHRHRVAPEAATLVGDLMAAGSLRMIAGRTAEIRATGDALHVPIRLRGSAETTVIAAGRVINCSGPQIDYTQLSNPLIRSFLRRGLLTPHPLQVGTNVADDGALVGSDGRPSDRLYAIGPVRFGTLIETTAIPEIREQAHDIARLLCAVTETNPTSAA
jgi:uncharacterized NAD(P)/FAD-binding protein YdhS